MKEFFNVTELDKVLEYAADFAPVSTETVPLAEARGRVLAEEIRSDADLPGFSRATMDGYAVRARSTFGATEANPAYLELRGTIAMGETPDFSIGHGEAARISTGGMLPEGADGVVMIEHTDAIDEQTIEVYRSVAPGQHIVERGEDFREGAAILAPGALLRPAEAGLLAAFGKPEVRTYKKPVVGIISTGDEVVDIHATPGPGQIRDINTYTLSAMVEEAGGVPRAYGIVGDDYDALLATCKAALERSDMVIISGGSSVGTRDFTIEALENLPETEILVHGISISPGKPTILARAGKKPFWGLPGHVVSAMVVFEVVVRPFIRALSGLPDPTRRPNALTATISRNVASAQGRVDFVRVRLREEGGTLWADPVLGKSGLINTMVKADGLVPIDKDTEGVEKGSPVSVLPLTR